MALNIRKDKHIKNCILTIFDIVVNMQKIHLLRHSITEANSKELIYGSTDLPITFEGIELIKKRKANNLFPTVDKNCNFYTSGMLRAETTLTLVYGDVPRKIISDLREYDFGKYEMSPYNEDYIKLEELSFLRLHSSSEYLTKDENIINYVTRIKRGLNTILNDTDGDALAVCHSGTIATLMMLLFTEKPTGLGDWFPAPCEGYTLIYENKKLVEYLKA